MRVSVIQYLILNTFYKHHPVQLATNMIRASSANAYGFSMKSPSQQARQADGINPLNVIGEVHCHLTRSETYFQLDALVVQQLDVEILAGNPFLVSNDIAVLRIRY